jgi:hypothetical protein
VKLRKEEKVVRGLFLLAPFTHAKTEPIRQVLELIYKPNKKEVIIRFFVV